MNGVLMLRDMGKDFASARLPGVNDRPPLLYYFRSTTLIVSVELSLA
jgi:hypothetical protein